jgi:hypothetical protein
MYPTPNGNSDHFQLMPLMGFQQQHQDEMEQRQKHAMFLLEQTRQQQILLLQQQHRDQLAYHQQQQLLYAGYSHSNLGVTSPPAVPCPPAPATDLFHPGDNPNSRVRFTPMLSVYSNPTDLDEIIDTCWYSRGDLKDFKGERKFIIRMLKQVNFDASRIDTSVYDLRGLEPYSSVRLDMMFLGSWRS